MAAFCVCITFEEVLRETVDREFLFEFWFGADIDTRILGPRLPTSAKHNQSI